MSYNNFYSYFRLGTLLLALAFQARIVAQTLETDPALQTFVDHYLDTINGVVDAWNETEYEAQFSTVFVVTVSHDEFLALTDELQATGNNSWAVVETVSSEGLEGEFLIAPASGEPVLSLSVSLDANEKVDYLVVKPKGAQPLENPPETIQEAVDRLEAKAQNVAFLIATDDGESACKVLTGQNVEEVAPFGSMFKLYVLAAVVELVEEGSLSWDQPVEIVNQYRSYPNGIVYDDPPGSNRTVRELARLMISISDNTATDHLMGLVGRSVVEQVLADYGHHNPNLNKPFLYTREFFLLKLEAATGSGPDAFAYATANEEEQREILADMRNRTVDTVNLPANLSWTAPVAIEEAEWFGTQLDLCHVLTRLYKNEEAANILSINPGISDQKDIWSYIGYKGGSEPGVLGVAWYLEASGSNTTRIVSVSVWDTVRALDETETLASIETIRDLSLNETKETDLPPQDDVTSSAVPQGLGVVSALFVVFSLVSLLN